MSILRERLGKHSLKLNIYKSYSGKTVSDITVFEVLKSTLSKAKFSEKTWLAYTKRLINFFIYTGYFVRSGEDVIVQDIGAPVVGVQSHRGKGKRRGIVFSANASPSTVCEVLDFIHSGSSLGCLLENGYRNALSVLKRFELIYIKDELISLNSLSISKYGGNKEAIWSSAKNEPVISRCIEQLHTAQDISGLELGKYISTEFNLSWTTSSQGRNGRGLRQWSSWVKSGIEMASIPSPPGLKAK